MPYSRYVIALIVSVLVVSNPAFRAQAALTTNCHALLIGISKYSLGDSERPLGVDGRPIVLFSDIDCGADVARMKLALENTFKFQPSEIDVLEEGDATRQNILGALDKLITETKPGDIVYIHYSGHGSQVIDPSEPDGLDSTIVPIDYRINASTFVGGHETSELATHEISGKTIRARLDLLEAKHPKQVILSFDSCHSGMSTRGASKVRGISYKALSDMLTAEGNGVLPTPAVKVGMEHTRGPASFGQFDDLVGAHYVVFSACESNEVDTEADDNGVAMGPLSYCLTRAFASASTGETYQQIFNQIQAQFQAEFPSQHPQLDGDPATQLFGDLPAATVHTMPVTYDAAAHQYQLDAGKFQDVTAGSMLAIYPANATKFENAGRLATAKVTVVRDTSAVIACTPIDRAHFNINTMVGSQAVETSHNYAGQTPITVDAASIRSSDPADADTILTAIKSLPVVTTTYAPGALPDITMARVADAATGASVLALGRPAAPAAPTRSGLSLPLQSTLSTVYRTVDSSGDIAHQVSDDLDEIARYQYAIHLAPPATSPGGAINVAVRLLPAVTTTDSGGIQHWSQDLPMPESGFAVGDIFTIEACNNGSEPAHVAVLDLDSTAKVSVAWPPSTYTLQDNVIPAHSGWKHLWTIDAGTSEPKLYQFNAADPAEEYKAIATNQYVDLTGLQTRGAATSSPFDTLFSRAIVSRDATALATTPAPSSWSAQITVVNVAPEKQ